MLKITQAQLDKHNILLKRFNTEIPSLLPDSYTLVSEKEAQPIEAYYGRMFIHIGIKGDSNT